MVIIRLSRHGSKKRPFYHIVAADSRRARDGRYLERLGFFNPLSKGKDIKVKVDSDRVAYWQQNGAQVSDRVQSLLKDLAKEKQETAA